MRTVSTSEQPVTLPAPAVTALRGYLDRADAVWALPHNPDRVIERHSILSEMAGYLRPLLEPARTEAGP